MTFDNDVFSVWRAIAAFGVCLAAIPLAGLWLRKRLPARPADGSELKLRDRLEIAPGVLLVSVENGGKEYLLSVSGGKTQLIDSNAVPTPAAVLQLVRATDDEGAAK